MILSYDGDKTVKEQNLHALQTQFEDLNYLRLSTIVNYVASIGHNFGDFTILRKIMWILPKKRFGSKIDAITKATDDIKTLFVNQLVSMLHDYKIVSKIA